MIPIYKPSLNGREKEYVNQCIDSTWISSKGEFVERFEESFSEYIGAKYATTVCNGTVALHLALESLGIGPGDEVIVPTLTYIASVNTIIQTGAKPVFVDSLAATWQLDPEDARRKISSKTKAIMAVHIYGLPCEMDTLVELCAEHELLLIEDCAEAFGSLYKGQHVGTFGDAATFSFFGNKTITTGEGGMVVCKNEKTHHRACHLKNQGVSPTREYWHDTLAFNYRMTNICAAIGLAQLEQADVILANKRQIAQGYADGLAGLPVSLQVEQEDTRHSYWMCSLLVDMPEQRDSLRDHLKTSNIDTRPLFPPCHEMPHCRMGGTFPVAENLSLRGINLPSFPALSGKDVALISSSIATFFDGV